MKRASFLIQASLALLAVLGTGGVASANNETATDLFVGSATTGAGQPTPVDVDPADVIARADGAIGLGYVYRAIGTARGRLPGDFSYEERGYLFFVNPSDPTTFAGSSLVSAAFTLTPSHHLPVVRIINTDPGAYRSGVETVKVSQVPPGTRRTLGHLSAETRALRPRDGSITYGYFTFTDDHGTFTGYSTPDSRQFAIRITFSTDGDRAGLVG
ncbi:MAG: hypothetical protein ACRDIY_02835 [Chloroflexota bacterium]